jgi:hypothetical protein
MYTSNIVGKSQDADGVTLTTNLVRFFVAGPPSGLRDIGVAFNTGGNADWSPVIAEGNGIFLENVWVSGGKYGVYVKGTDINLDGVVAELNNTANFYFTEAEAVRANNLISYQSQNIGLFLEDGAVWTPTATNHGVQVLINNFTDSESVGLGIHIKNYDDVMISNSGTSTVVAQRPVRGLMIEDSARTQLSNVSILHAEYEGIRAEDSTEVTISNPMIDAIGDFTTLDGSTPSNGIAFSGCTNCSVYGGVLANLAGNGIAVFNSTGTIQGVRIVNPAQKADADHGLYGILVTGGSSTDTALLGNTISGNSVVGSVGLRLDSGAANFVLRVSDNRIAGFPVPFTYDAAFVPRNSRWGTNLGIVTESNGTGSVASGATTAVVNHGLDFTPTLDEIEITFGEQGTNDYGRWSVGTITSTQFTLTVASDPGASNLDFGWRARIQ